MARSHHDIDWQQRWDEVRCPSCRYQLRGLPGVVVRCPECGRPCDRVSELAMSRRNWSITPTYERLMRPAMCFVALLVVLPLLWGFLPYVDQMHARIGIAAASAVTGILVVTWLVLLIRGAMFLPGGAGLGDVLLVHAIVIGYLLLSFSIIVGALCLIIIGVDLMGSRLLMTGLPPGPAIVVVLLLISAIIVYYLLRLLYRLDARVGRRCVRHEAQLRLPHALKNEHGPEHHDPE